MKIDEQKRTREFSRNTVLESLLHELNQLLTASETIVLEKYKRPAFPIVFVMGPHRSGTTLFMQWLASTGIAAYPTNLLSRFYQAPVIGAKIQLLLTDPRYNFRNELGEFVQQTDYTSENGKTIGALSPNEFWYFWRRFLPDPVRDDWSDAELKCQMDIETLLAELAGIMDVFQKPFAAKGMLFNYNIPFLDSIFDKALFVRISRDLVTNTESVLEARRRQLGRDDKWYSFKIPEYDQLKGLEPIMQAAGQVSFINMAVDKGMAQVAIHRKLNVQYEKFCSNPKKYYDQIVEKLAIDCPAEYNGPRQFDITRKRIIPDYTLINAALDYWKHQQLTSGSNHE
jgi:hypothetical protein